MVRTRRIAKWLTLLWLAAALIFSTINYKGIPELRLFSGPRISLAVHFLAYFAGNALWAWAYPPKRRLQSVTTAAILLILGAGLESIQLYLPFRTFNPKDLLANALGVLSFNLLLFLIAIRNPK